MADAVYVHVGSPKTGTTYLQDTLWVNRDALGRDGVLVPGGRRFAAFHAAQAIREVPWLADMPAGRRDVWDDMRERIGEWPGVAVLSHEFLGAATSDQAAAAIAALAPAEVHVVLTARDYVSQLPALWQEAVKMGAQRPLDDYVDHLLSGTKKGPWGIDSVDAVGVLGRWGATVPAARVHVVTVPPQGSPPGLLWQRFGAVCGIDPSRYQVPDRPANESLGIVETELVRLVGRRLPEALRPKRVRYRWLRGYFAHEVLAGRGGQRPTLSPDAARRVREWGEASVRTLGRTWLLGAREPGRAALLHTCPTRRSNATRPPRAAGLGSTDDRRAHRPATASGRTCRAPRARGRIAAVSRAGAGDRRHSCADAAATGC